MKSITSSTTRSSVKEESSALRPGAVTFLDVLGWKGIWLRREAPEVIRQLRGLVTLASKVAEEQRGTAAASSIEVISISDTIVLLAEGSPEATLQTHGMICSKLLPLSVRQGLPLRGATAYGRYAKLDNIVVGPAVDEAAAWHEAAEWLGVVLTPTAEYSYTPSPPWREYPSVPIKALGERRLHAIDWTEESFGEHELKKIFSEAGPLDPLVGAKYMNTLDFVSAMIRARNASGDS